MRQQPSVTPRKSARWLRISATPVFQVVIKVSKKTHGEVAAGKRRKVLLRFQTQGSLCSTRERPRRLGRRHPQAQLQFWWWSQLEGETANLPIWHKKEPRTTPMSICTPSMTEQGCRHAFLLTWDPREKRQLNTIYFRKHPNECCFLTCSAQANLPL